MLKMSVIVPVYNVEKYLAQCLDSLLGQNIDEMEIICVEDKSTDNSLKILKEYALKDKRIKIIENDRNGGLAFSRNQGIRKAEGKYIAFVDSDDKLVENALPELYKYAEENDLEGVVYKLKSIIEYDNAENEYISEEASDEIDGKICTGKALFIQFSKDLWWRVGSPHYVWKRDFIVGNELYFCEGMIYEDVIHTFRCLMKAERIGNRNVEYYIYRKRNSSIMRKMKYRYVESRFLIFNELYVYWKIHSDEEELGEAIRVYLERTIKLFMKEKSYFPQYEPLSLGNSADKYLFELIYRYGKSDEGSNFKWAFFSEEKIKKLREASKILIYGAGNVGKEVVALLEQRGIPVDGIAVSGEVGTSDKLNGRVIKNISEYADWNEDAVVILAVVKKYHEEILERLEEYHFQNIMYLDKQ